MVAIAGASAYPLSRVASRVWEDGEVSSCGLAVGSGQKGLNGASRGRKGIMKNIKVYRMRLLGPLKRGLGYQGFIKVACGMTFNIMFLIGFY
ncbi:hypothetical protein OB952_02395 [Aeromonas salmonicida]|uniref:hypothetical protein n=1 Tax=Aeromonas TaxID=642 RepID=UPI00259FC529|nr:MULTISPECIES: hypothetical protein [Aeromonas]MDM5066232.1 hypothetical protein [Aeromonas salmonicida]